MGSTLRHVFDNPGSLQANPITLGVVLFVLFCLWLMNRRSSFSFVFTVACALLLCDMPYDQSLAKRSGVLKPLFMAALGRDEL